MPIFRLTPTPARLDDPAWADIPVRSECWVNAADEDEARGMASARFQNAKATVPGHPAAPSAWRSAELVSASVEAQGPDGLEVPYGTVVAGPHM